MCTSKPTDEELLLCYGAFRHDYVSMKNEDELILTPWGKCHLAPEFDSQHTRDV